MPYDTAADDRAVTGPSQGDRCAVLAPAAVTCQHTEHDHARHAVDVATGVQHTQARRIRVTVTVHVHQHTAAPARRRRGTSEQATAVSEANARVHQHVTRVGDRRTQQQGGVLRARDQDVHPAVKVDVGDGNRAQERLRW